MLQWRLFCFTAPQIHVCPLPLVLFFLVWFQPPWQMGSGWAVVIKSQLKGCRWVCYTDTSTRLYIHSLLNVKPQFGRTCLVWFSSFAENCSHCCHVSDAVLYYECQDEIHKKFHLSPEDPPLLNRFFHCDTSDPILILDIFPNCRGLYLEEFCYRFHVWLGQTA